MTRAERIQHWRDHIAGRVEGWVEPDMWRAIEVCGDILDEAGVHGPIAEFGVHHGLFLFLIDALRDDDEAVTHAIGIWDDPTLKSVTPGPGWDRMQEGSWAQFKRNVRDFCPREIWVRTEDTFNLFAQDLRSAFGAGLKFLSIDAGHTPANVINDLALAEEVLAPGGIIALDDYLNPYWEGVTDGFYRYMMHHNRRLRSFMFFRNKLFLTTISEHRDYVKSFHQRMGDFCDLRSVAGHECLVERPWR